MYEKVDESEARGNEFVSTRWILTNEGDSERLDILALFVGRESGHSFKHSGGFHHSCHEENGEIIVLDVSRAHFHPQSRRELYIRLPAEDSMPGPVGTLSRSLYGTRDVANAWNEFFNNAALELIITMIALPSCERQPRVETR